MLSVITKPEGEAAALTGLLSDLVPAAVKGLVRDVLVLDPGNQDDDLAVLCEASGARRISGGLGVAVRQARSDLLLLASPGLRLDAFALDRLERVLADLGAEGLGRGVAVTAPAPLGLGFLARPKGLVTARAHLLGVAAGTGLEAALAHAAKGAFRLQVAG